MLSETKVVQLGGSSLSYLAKDGHNIKWFYEPDFLMLDNEYIDVLIICREITEEEFNVYNMLSKAYCVFIIEDIVNKQNIWIDKIRQCKVGTVLSRKKLEEFIKNDVPDYFSEPYGAKVRPQFLSISKSFEGTIINNGYENIELDGDFGEDFTQVVYWKKGVPVEVNQAIDFWLEYEKEGNVEICLYVTKFVHGTISRITNKWIFNEKDMRGVKYIKNHVSKASLFFSLKAKGNGKLKISSLHYRHSRRDKGYFIAGGQRKVLSNREEIFYYFDPGNFKPPFNIYFSGWRTKEGFEGYKMMRKYEHPYMLITDTRLAGGSFYLGDKEYEDAMIDIITKHIELLKFDNSQVIMSGLSMGTFGAMYYGSIIKPNAIIVGKPIASMGTAAINGRNEYNGGGYSDFLHKSTGGYDEASIVKLDNKFWDAFDNADWSKTKFAVAYMIDDEIDGTAYNGLQEHLKDAGAIIYGKGIRGKHNDNTPGIVAWFRNQYKEIIDEFDNK